MNCLVTGATGFVGKVLIPELEKQAGVVTPSRHEWLHASREGKQRCSLFEGIDVVVHLANIAHTTASEAELESINHVATVAFAKAAAKSGVKRFIYLSSIKVLGESTSGSPFRFDQPAAPQDAYGRSKLAAELGIKEITATSDMDYVIIRPPLVYGPGVKGNLALLVAAVDSGQWLPFSGIANKRDLLSVRNLVDLICCCGWIPEAADQTLLCCDGGPISTPELVLKIANARGRTAHLKWLPLSLLRTAAGLVGKGREFERLSEDLCIDMQHTIDLLGWEPPFAMGDSLKWAFSLQDD